MEERRERGERREGREERGERGDRGERGERGERGKRVKREIERYGFTFIIELTRPCMYIDPGLRSMIPMIVVS